MMLSIVDKDSFLLRIQSDIRGSKCTLFNFINIEVSSYDIETYININFVSFERRNTKLITNTCVNLPPNMLFKMYI